MLIIESTEEYSSVYIVPHSALPDNFTEVRAVFADRSMGKTEAIVSTVRSWEAWVAAWRKDARNAKLHWTWSGSATDVNITEVVHFSIVF